MAAGGVISSALGSHVECFAGLGLVLVLYWAWKHVCFVVTFTKTYILGKFFTVNVKHLGQWAVVTGCTDGIGKAYVEQLAKRGCDVVLISRSSEKLKELATQIESKYGVSTLSIVADFGYSNVYDDIKTALHGLDIGILVNNVGKGYDWPEYFLEIPSREKTLEELIAINVTAMTRMTSIVLPEMVDKRKGAIVNVSSFAACYPIPLLSVYSATKVYMDYLSRSLQQEYRSKGIIIQSVMPYYVATKLSKIRRTSLLVPSPSTYVKSALSVLGLETSGNAYWPHALLTKIVEHTPTWLFDKYMLYSHSSIRKRALKRKAEKGE